MFSLLLIPTDIGVWTHFWTCFSCFVYPEEKRVFKPIWSCLWRTKNTPVLNSSVFSSIQKRELLCFSCWCRLNRIHYSFFVIRQQLHNTTCLNSTSLVICSFKTLHMKAHTFRVFPPHKTHSELFSSSHVWLQSTKIRSVLNCGRIERNIGSNHSFSSNEDHSGRKQDAVKLQSSENRATTLGILGFKDADTDRSVLITFFISSGISSAEQRLYYESSLILLTLKCAVSHF